MEASYTYVAGVSVTGMGRARRGGARWDEKKECYRLALKEVSLSLNFD